MERNSNSPTIVYEYRKKTIIFIALLMGVFMGIFSGCIYPKQKFGSDSNAYRKKLGLEILPNDWKAISVGENFTIWKNPIADKLLQEGKPLFFSKSVKYNQDNKLVSEEDLYYSGKKFTTIDGSESESVSIKYFFRPQKLGDNEVEGWYCTYTGPENFTNFDKAEETPKEFVLTPSAITLTASDSILRKWNLTPPVRK